MAKKVQAYVKLPGCSWYGEPESAGWSSTGQQGVNIMEFCKAFNAKTDSIEKGRRFRLLLPLR
ncbi:50S ribosomal protein L11 [Salmonella enterica subsp. enterica]|uniref:50S ribosomal protein L11 n=1 Tax=Salmonella enterica I TaxID=59201 RepID=A0A379X4N5_SALET|nr:50S ribosomal protein L11 [Salmonella enterica subsp. enterica]